MAYYHNDFYIEADEWRPIGATQKDTAWVGYVGEGERSDEMKRKSEILFYPNDPNDTFISYDSRIDEVHTLRKTSTILPEVYSAKLTKIVLRGDSDVSIMPDDDLLKDFQSFLKLVYSKKYSKVREMQIDSKPTVPLDVYFDGLSVYLEYGELAFLDLGKVVLLADYNNQNFTYEICVYLPKEISQRIINLYYSSH
jgi:hypothetical protein